MMKRTLISLVALVAALTSGPSLFADGGTYGAFSPYSVFGIGDLSRQGTAVTRGMGYVGLATRDNRFINVLNPASLTARDTLSFMADFGLSGKSVFLHSGSARSANSTLNLYNFVMTFPVYKSFAMEVGILPLSDVGYKFRSVETDPAIIGHTGNITYTCKGNGSVYQIYLGGAFSPVKGLSIGARGQFFFGTLDKTTGMKYTDASYRSMSAGYELTLRGFTGKLGVQYEKSLGNGLSLTAGATWRPRTRMRGYANDFAYTTISSVTDTLRHTTDNLSKTGHVRFGDEWGIGLSLGGNDKWRVELDYLQSGWKGTGIDRANGFASVSEDSRFTAATSRSLRAGFSIVPNRNDIRYYMRRCDYRAGVYYDEAYYRMNGNRVAAYGITLGMTLPVFRLYNGLSLGLDLGRRGSSTGRMIGENYIQFHLGVNIHDKWFIKPRYE